MGCQSVRAASVAGHPVHDLSSRELAVGPSLGRPVNAIARPAVIAQMSMIEIGFRSRRGETRFYLECEIGRRDPRGFVPGGGYSAYQAKETTDMKRFMNFLIPHDLLGFVWDLVTSGGAVLVLRASQCWFVCWFTHGSWEWLQRVPAWLLLVAGVAMNLALWVWLLRQAQILNLIGGGSDVSTPAALLCCGIVVYYNFRKGWNYPPRLV